MWEYVGKIMSGLSIKMRALPLIAIGAALTLSACASNNANRYFNNGLNSNAYNVPKVKLPKTRYGGQYIVENNECCQPVICCQPAVQRPVIEVVNVVEVPAPAPAPIIEYVHEQPAPAPVVTPPPAIVSTPAPEPAPVYTPPPRVYEPTPAPVYTPPPAPSCPEGQIPAYGGQGCIPIVPLRK